MNWMDFQPTIKSNRYINWVLSANVECVMMTSAFGDQRPFWTLWPVHVKHTHTPRVMQSASVSMSDQDPKMDVYIEPFSQLHLLSIHCFSLTL